MNRKNVEDLYPLSPLQQGMLFHTLYSPGSGAYLEQMTMRLAGKVDADAFRRAWQTVVDRHPILRTGFVWDGVPQPLQVVFRQVELPFIDGDWRALPADEQERRFAAELQAERAAGLDLARAPLVRVRLFRTGEREHRFALTIHHMLIDGWSLPILLGEFAALYDGFLHGTHPHLPNRRPFRDYVSWLRQQDAGAAEAYWRGRLDGFTAPTPLPLDCAPAREGAPAESYAQARVVLDAALVAAIEAAARRMRATPSGVLQCAWAVVLAAYAGTRDVVFGATVSGRPPELPGVEEMVGMFINTVPVRIRVPRTGTVAEWVQAAHAEQAEARLYEHAPLAELRGWSGVPAERPLFETLLVYENYPVDALRHADAFDAAQTEPDDDGFEVVEAHSPERTNFPLSLVSAPEAGAFRIGATYDSNRLDEASVRALLDGLVRVVSRIAEDPSRPVAELTPVAPEEAERLTRGMATPSLAYDRGDTVHALVARAAAASPDAVAVVHDGRRMTYAELDARANRLAWRLRALGVGPEVSVGVCLRRTSELPIALLAVLKAGGAYVPLDPAYPAERLGYMLRNAVAAVVLAEHATNAALPWTDARVVLVDEEADAIAREPSVAPEDLAAAENLAWTLYTSGSTGQPKGVQIEHRAAVALLRWMRGWVAEEELSGVLFSTSVSFDVSVAELWFTLSAGGTLVMAENALHLADLDPAIGVRRVSMVPSAAAELVRGGLVPETVRTFALGGEPLAPAVVAAVHSLPHVRVVENLYGPTEDTTYSLAWRVPRGVERMLVGRPVAGSAAYVLDDLLRPVPAGARGDVYLAGEGLSRGYDRRPAQTAERFIPDPFGAPGARMYRTGDHGRWVEEVRECGSAEVRAGADPSESAGDALPHSRTPALEYLGRADFQVKVRGFRIEPGEIESLLLAHPAVSEAAVVARPGTAGDARLVAYVAGDAVPAASELKAHLAAALPDYMVPRAFVALSALPRTPNGKVDRAALPDAEVAAAAEFVAPEGLAEEALAEIWKEVLRRDRIGANDSFFELGGHSLLATQVVSRVRAAFGVELPLRTMFESTTLRALAAAIEDLLIADIESAEAPGAAADAAPQRDAATEAPAEPVTAAAQSDLGTPASAEPAGVVPVVRGGLLATSLGQERLWFLDRLNPGSVPARAVAVDLPESVDGDALARAVAEVVRRHEVLRTTFADVAGRPMQRVHPFAGFALETEDVGDAPAAGEGDGASAPAPADRVAVAIAAEAARPFDLAAGPLFRARLIRGGAPVLVLAAHATVADDASLQRLALEIAFHYQAFRRGESSPLPEPALQYADFAAWQRAAVASEGVERRAEAWRARLDGAPSVLDLPADHPRPAARTFAAAATEVALDAGTVARIRELAAREGMVPDAVLLALWELLLSRLSGADDLLVGLENPGPAPLTEQYGGPLANTLVLRAGIRAGDPFRAHLARVRDELTAAQVSGVPFERLLDEIPVERSLSRAPLVQAGFAFRRAPGSVEMEGVRTLPISVAPAATEPDLALDVVETGDGLRVRLIYAAELFDAATAVRWGDALAALLASALDDPSRAVGDLAWMDDAARDAVLALGAGEAAEIPASPIHRLFEAHAAARPDAPALVGDGVRVTYAEANARANRIARRLRELGVRAEGRVGVALPRSPELVIALLAVLKAGAAYVPLDPVYPRERLAAMRRDAGVSVVITDAADEGEGLFSLVGERGRIDALPDGDLADVDVSPEGLAYVVYTSGSTGTPKGVAVPHRAVVRLVRGQAYARFAADEVFLQLAPVAFDASTFEIWGALLNGAALAIHPPATPGPAELGAFVARHGATQLWLTAGLFHQVVDAGAPGLRGVRRLLAGGDVLSPAHVRRAMELLPDTELVDGYGPTESTTFATTHAVTRADADAGDIPIGRPIANTRAYLLDTRLRPVPVGVPGDLYLGGAGLARGYLGAPALTAERFVPDPFGTGERLYRTGDRARWIGARGGASEAPGNALPHALSAALQFLGRADRQLKVRGFRIEPGEVEAALLTHPAVREAVAGAVGSGGAKRLVAWIVPAAGEAVGSQVLRAHLSRILPEHAVPSAFVPVTSIPLTPNGKVDRAALPLPGDEAAARPLTPTEEAIAADWRELLGAPEVGADDDFFALGGHSFLAAQVIERIRGRFGVDLPLRGLFESPRLSALAACVDARVRSGGAANDTIVPIPRGGDLPVSFAQERMWFLQQLDPSSALYNLATPLRLRGRLDVRALERAFEELVRRHEPLRTVFASVDGRPVQRIRAAAPVAIPVTDLSHLADPQAEALRLVNEDMRAPFDLERGPLYRAALLRLTPMEHVLILDVHHAVTDGWSVSVMVNELAALYAAFAAGRPSPLEELPVQYADFAAWQRRWLTEDRVRAQVEWWMAQLGGAPPALELPTDRPRGAVQRHRGAIQSLAVAPELFRDVRALSARHGATVAMTVLAAFQLVLGRLAGQDDVVIGTPIAGRTRLETEGMVGLFLNTLAIRTHLAGGDTFAALLARVRESMLGAFANQHVPFERLLEELSPERSLSRTPVFQVMFNMLNLEGAHAGRPHAAGGPDLAIESFAGEMEVGSKFDVTLYARPTADGLLLDAAYDADLFTRERIDEMLRQVVSVLRQAAADPARRLDALSLRTPDAAAVLPDPVRPLPARTSAPVPARVSARAAASPGAPAISDPSGTWTYGEVEAASNRVARLLGERGIAKGDVVAVVARRTAWLPVAMLGIAKAGAAWAILDPAYPAARLAERLAAARPRALVTIGPAGDLPTEMREVAGGLGISATLTLGDPAHPDAARLASTSAEAVRVPIGADDLAYLAFTSGTTGAPKTVAGTHGPVAHFLDWYADQFGPQAHDRVSMLSGLAHDPLLRDLFVPLASGATLCIPDADRIGEPGWLARWFADEGITIAHLTPAMGRLLASPDGRLGSLRLAAFGGDALTSADVEGIRSIAPAAEVVNFYGATETPQAIAFHRVSEEMEDGGRVPVGRGIDGVQLLVMAPGGGLAGIGELGEVAVRTPYLARGYPNDAELTAARFRPNPFTGDAADRVYRTGDLGRYRPDGAVELAGRADRQVQVRGFRVEPGEVEAALATHPSIRAAAVVPRDASDGDRRLVAYVAIDVPDEALDAELRAHLRSRLPEHMVPSAFVRLDALPLTANGKVDLRALPDPDERASAGAYVPPRTAAEQVVAEIWGEVLKTERVGVDDNFFALGGHSLLATQVLSRVEQAFGVKLPVRAIFEHPTVAALAAELESAAGGVLAEAEAELAALSDEELAAMLAELEGAEGD